MQVGELAGAPAMAPLRRQHDQIEGVRTLDLEPALAPIAGFVGGIERLRHDTLMAGRERGLIEGARRGFRGGDEPWDLQRRRYGLAERLEALARRAGGDAQRIDSQAVEEESLGRQRGAQLFGVELAP